MKRYHCAECGRTITALQKRAATCRLCSRVACNKHLKTTSLCKACHVALPGELKRRVDARFCRARRSIDAGLAFMIVPAVILAIIRSATAGMSAESSPATVQAFLFVAYACLVAALAGPVIMVAGPFAFEWSAWRLLRDE